MSDMKNYQTCGTLVPNYLPVTRDRVAGEYVEWIWPPGSVIYELDLSGARGCGQFVSRIMDEAFVKNERGMFRVPFATEQSRATEFPVPVPNWIMAATEELCREFLPAEYADRIADVIQKHVPRESFDRKYAQYHIYRDFILGKRINPDRVRAAFGVATEDSSAGGALPLICGGMSKLSMPADADCDDCKNTRVYIRFGSEEQVPCPTCRPGS